MTNNDWQNMGNDIRNMVQNAIDSQNFRELNRNINQAVNSAMNGLNEGVRRANENLQQAAERNMSRRQANNWTAGRRETSYQYTHEKEPAQNPWKWSAGQTRANQVRRPGYQPPNPLYGSTNGLMGGGTALAVLGWISASGLGIATLVLSILNFVVGTVGIGIGLGIVAPLFVGSGVMAWGGMKMLSRAKRFRSYVAKLGQRTYCDIKELALAVGKSERFVQKDVAKMIQKRMFRQGHLDRQGKCLMTSNETYQLYLNTMQQIEQKKKEAEKIEADTREKNEQLPEEARKVIEQGNRYLQDIKESNDAIPGEEISAKISQMEVIVQKILTRVEQDPTVVSDLQKFMNYYLPTTVKLLDAYEQLDAQPIQGENIASSKKEIEDTLDTINQAFETLLDRFFQDTAWDISSDISAMQTMFAQEGLTKTAFERSAKGN